ncbi:MAG: hypothetical protein B6D61_09445 [Bacteroidetes bacterium 4484_249]|nr:MAG: hypothetical protein B6D61_09445 [Bacteroidetes bacterium 4484_249]
MGVGSAMKKGYIIVVLILFGLNCFAQDGFHLIQSGRDSIYQKYRGHKDTMVIRTWLNVVTSNNYLEQLLSYDSMLIANYKNAGLQLTTDISALRSDFKSLSANYEELKNKSLTQNIDARTRGNYFIIALVVAVVCLVLLIIVWARFIKQGRQIGDLNDQIKDYHTKLYNANIRIGQFEQNEFKLASEINNQKTNCEEQLLSLQKEKENAEDDRQMMANQISEVKRAYDLEVQKREGLEVKLALAAENADIVEESKTILLKANEMAIQLKEGKQQNILLEAELENVNKRLQAEVGSRMKIEEELSSLLNKIKTEFNN